MTAYERELWPVMSHGDGERHDRLMDRARDLCASRRLLARAQGYDLTQVTGDKLRKPICRLSMKKETGKQDE